jgi:parallel beta-helix repeat protein
MNSTSRIVNPGGPASIIVALLSFLSLGPQRVSQATTYYVDGNSPVARDTNPGTQAQPWKTIGKATSLVNAGDTVFVKAGVYRETVVLSRSGTSTTANTRSGLVTTTSPITITAYPGHEGKAIINAAEPVTNWRKCPGPQDCAGNPNWSHIYWADVASFVAAHPDKDFAVRQVFQNSQRLPRSRFPNTRWNYPTTVVNPKTTFADSTLSIPPAYFNGAVCHIKTAQWRIDQIPIASSSGTTIVLAWKPWYDISTHFGYYITSIVGEINAPGEWAYDATRKRLYLWPRGEVASDVEFSYRKNCLRTNDRVSYTVVRGLTMRYAYEHAVWLYLANNMTIENNTIEYAVRYGIELQSTFGPCNDNQILRNTIKYCGYRAINVDSAAARCKIEGNYVYAAGVENFGGDLLYGRGEGIYVVGPFARVYHNRIDRTGTVGLYLHGGALGREVSYNHITNSALALSDTGAIYMAGRAEGSDKDYVHHNIIENTLGCETMDKGNDTGAPPTSPTYAGDAHGIYVDEEANHRIIEDNTVIRSSSAGIYFHWAPTNLVQRNTLYGNGMAQIRLSGKDEEHKALVEDVFLDNILFATDGKQRTLYLTMNYNNVRFGQSDRNYFYNPFADIHIFVSRYLTPSSGEWHDYLTLSGWRTMSGYDRNSREFSYLNDLPQVTLARPTKAKIVSNASLDANTVDLGPDLYCDVQGHGIRGKLTLQPFESKILISAVEAVLTPQATNPMPADGDQMEGVPMLE